MKHDIQAAHPKRMRSCGLLCHWLRAAQVGPIHIGPHLLAPDNAIGFALDVDRETLADALTRRNGLSDVAHRRSTPASERFTVRWGKVIEIGQKFIHAQTLPNSNAEVNTIWSFTGQ